MTTMTPDQFFDELDKLFGTDDGYVNHLKRIIDLKHLKEEMEENWLSEEDVSAQVDPLYEEIKNTKKNAMKQVHKLNKQLKELKDENKKLKQFKDDVIDASQWDNDATVADHEYIDYIKEMESAYDMELKEKITCLESDSMNEVSQAQFDEMVEEKDEKIKELKDGERMQILLKEQEITKRIKLEKQLTNLQMNHIDMKCEITGRTLTEDDLQMSLDVGRLICESAYDDLDYDDKKTRTELKVENKKLKWKLTEKQAEYDFLKETSINKTMNTNSTDDIIKLEEENKELKKQMKM